MSDKKKNENSNEKQKQQLAQSNVIQLSDHKCKAENCKSKTTRAGFCDTHYMWFKEGLITAEGYNAKDFEKKYALFVARQRKTA